MVVCGGGGAVVLSIGCGIVGADAAAASCSWSLKRFLLTGLKSSRSSKKLSQNGGWTSTRTKSGGVF